MVLIILKIIIIAVNCLIADCDTVVFSSGTKTDLIEVREAYIQVGFSLMCLGIQ